MKVIGLTGGIGMGKSTSSAFLRERGIPVLDTDIVAREIVEPGQPALEEIRKAFGDSVVDASGRLRRDTLAYIIFSSESRRKELEAITHPKIRARWEQAIATWRKEGIPLAFVVIPLLYEIQAQSGFDAVVCVACSPASQLERMARRGWSPEECQRRIAAQWPAEKKMALADFVVWTEGDLASHVAQWDQLLAKLS